MAATFWKKMPFKTLIVSALGLNIVAILIFVLLKGFLPPIVPLLYGRPSGEGQLLPVLELLIAPSLSICLIVINGIIANITADSFSKKLLASSAFMVSLLTTITLIKVIFLVGFF